MLEPEQGAAIVIDTDGMDAQRLQVAVNDVVTTGRPMLLAAGRFIIALPLFQVRHDQPRVLVPQTGPRP